MPTKDPVKLSAKYRRRTLRRRVRILSHYSEDARPVCACCGESRLEFLALDHIDGGGNRHRAEVGGGQIFYLSLQRAGFPPGFRVLCHNCNLARGLYGYCPHEDAERAAATLAMLLPRKRGAQRTAHPLPFAAGA